jgi:hypothetical protein
MIEDQRIATGYPIEALRVFDHLHFRSRMKAATSGKKKETLSLRLPRAISGKAARAVLRAGLAEAARPRAVLALTA